MTLVISFFVCIFSGESPGIISEAEWMAYVPFTAVLVMPGRILIGMATVGQGIISAALIAVCAVVMCMISGKAYTALAFYKSKPLNPMWLIKNVFRRS
jgi:ABC-type Na+ efflux pump permease subunit